MAKEKATSFLNIALDGTAALCRKGKTVPFEIQLFAAGEIPTNDGRNFVNDNPDRIIVEFKLDGRPLPIDVDHQIEITYSGPAYGWVNELENRNGELWAKVEWTPKGEQAISSKEYRYVSPAFLHDENGHIQKLLSVAITNKPAFPDLKALASEHPKTVKENKMDRKALCSKLGLPEDATDEQIYAAIDKNKADLKTALASSVAPSLDKFVPRADYDQVVTDRNTAQTALASRVKEDDTAKATVLVDKGIANGQIAPASKDFYLGMCSKDGGLAEVEKFLESAPKIVATAAAAVDPDIAPGENKALTSEQKQVADAMGIPHKDYSEQLKLEAE